MHTTSVEGLMLPGRSIDELGVPVILGAGNSHQGLGDGSIHNAQQFADLLSAGKYTGETAFFTGYGPIPEAEYPVSEAMGMRDIAFTTGRYLADAYVDEDSYDTMGNVANLVEPVMNLGIDRLAVFGAVGHTERFGMLSEKRLPGIEVIGVHTLTETRRRARIREAILLGLGRLTRIGVTAGDQSSLNSRDELYRNIVKLPKELMFARGKSGRYVNDRTESQAT